jgi:hypothetical protein
MTTILYKDIPYSNDNSHPHIYSFLNNLDEHYNISNVYNMLHKYDSKLKNIYQFLYLRSIKMNTKFPHIQTLENVSNYIEPGQLNDLLNMYINNDTMYSILILNGILCYLYPPK